ncbi:FHF complex subunit HOOK interacting protein 2B isoform X2 [Eublepharis macularius]|uniref:FHF complex subunit HOOK interacting protein 2B isoform X2 n=1 Tax=Eublepharis macularius TaxID=481883 RepID=A0AA97KCL1_EUBMA|nr:FHF complex subunit HOOK interacting protein 2B isoform X2 [Eublepharis macularius]
MALLGRLGALLQRAVATEEPDIDLLAAFTEHWKGLTHYYLETTDENKPAKQTDIPWHLKQMLDILVYEEKQQPPGETGPCLEYLLQHKTLETLSTLGKAEYPPGMRSQVLLFFSRLLGQMQCPLLHYLSVYRPVQKLLQLGPELEKEMMQFIAVLCTKIRQEPALLPYVLEGKHKGKHVANGQNVDQPFQPQEATAESSDHVSKEIDPVKQGERLCPGMDPCGVSLVEPASSAANLVTSLINLCKSKKRKVAVKAQENLLLLTSIDHPTASLALAQDSMLCPLVAGYLCFLYDAVPADIDPANVAMLQPVSWRLQGNSAEENSFLEQLDLEVFFAWLDFCDCLVKGAPPTVARLLAEAVGQRLFVGRLQPQLLQMSEDGILLSTAILTGLVRQIRAPALIQELVVFLLRTGREPEVLEDPDHQPYHCLCSQLIERCNHLSDEISIVTLKFFEELLHLPDPRILQSLVLHNLEERRYILKIPSVQEEHSSQEQEPCEDGLELEEDPYFVDGFPAVGFQASRKPAVPAPKQPVQSEEKMDVKEVVNSFLCLVPSEAKTSAYLEEGGYDTYVHDASRMFGECLTNTSHWNWPQASQPLESCLAGSHFYEGHFLKVLFDRLAQILDQSYAVNLQVTSVLSRLALFPHPHLHEYLLDPYLPLAPGCRTLFSMLIRVIGDLMQRIQRVPDFPASLLLVRKRLLGLVPEDQQISHQMLLEGVVVLEEFCKELAAIAFVKSVPKGTL